MKKILLTLSPLHDSLGNTPGLHRPHFKNHCFKGTKGHFTQPGRVLGGFAERVGPELRPDGCLGKEGLAV